MFTNISWLFFDVGSTLIDEQFAYKHRLQDIAEAANTTYQKVYDTAMEFYKQNKKGDLETAKQLGVPLPKWHTEDEILYPDAAQCLKTLSRKYKIGIIANQELGTKDRLQQHGILQYIDLVIASAEEGVAKPDEKIFKIAVEKAKALGYEAVIVEGNPQNYNSRGFETSYQHGIVASPKIGLPAVECLMVKELVAGALSHIKGTVDYSDYECLR
jgi:HAD superfamily hydrolase (TIGR01549 family)